MADSGGILWNGKPVGDGSVTVTPSEAFKLLDRNYGSTLIRIGAHYIPRRSLIVALVESFLILCALIAATVLRFMHLGLVQDYLSQPRNLLRFVLVTVVCQFALYYNELYEVRTTRSGAMQVMRTLGAMGVALLCLSLLYYIFPPARLERGIAVVAACLTLSFLTIWRLTLEKTRTLTSPWERILILGTGQQGISLAQEILRRPELQYRVVGFLNERGRSSGPPLASPGIIGGVAEVEEVVAREHVDRVLISLGERRGVMPIRQLASLRLQGLPVEDVHSVYERLTGRIMLEHLQPSWLVLSDGFRKSRLVTTCKRAIDMLVSLALLILASPVMLVVAIAIVLESGKPLLFRQDRVGLGGRLFKVLKFRSMRVGSEKGTPSWTADGDPRITRVGKFIRKFRMDELPQLLNILRGQMSLIGPRPEVPYFCELLEREIPFFNLRHSVRPGLTGWAQVKYHYGATLEQARHKFEFDLFYIKHLSILLDLAIILETAKVVILGRGAK